MLRCFEVLGRDHATATEDGPRLTITQDVFREWVEGDQQSRETEGKPGFMDIFRLPGRLEVQPGGSRPPAEPDDPQRPVDADCRSSRNWRHATSGCRRTGSAPSTISCPSRSRARTTRTSTSWRSSEARSGSDSETTSDSSPCPTSRSSTDSSARSDETRRGLELNTILVSPGDSRPRTITLEIEPLRDVRIGHAFRRNSLAEVMATFSNTSPNRKHKVTIDILDDHTVRMGKHEEILFSEWVPGGTDIIVDNFNDTGRIDREPAGFIEKIICKNKDKWIVSGAIHAGHQE